MSQYENEISEDEVSEDEGVSQYIHFDDIQQCVDFLRYIEKLSYKVGHTCCGGLGCQILNIDNPTSHKIKKEFLAVQANKKITI